MPPKEREMVAESYRVFATGAVFPLHQRHGERLGFETREGLADWESGIGMEAMEA